jgi:hypothetical protein
MRFHGTAVLFVLATALSSLLALNASAVVFDDGGVHVIDANNSYPFEPVLVYDGPGSAVTSVEVMPGGEIGTFLTVGARTLQTYDHSVVNMTGGYVHGSADIQFDSAFNMTGGTIERTLFVTHDATADISGGEIRFSMLSSGSWVGISGGAVGGSSGGALRF